MTQTASSPVDALRAAIRGPVIVAGDADYETARTVWNADVDRRPAVVARCSSAEDVAAAVVFAVEHGLEIAVRGGAHSMSGACAVDDGIMIDLSRLNSVDVDPAAKRVKVGGGALLADLDAATQAHGLAVPAGVVSHTGIGGLALGGGMGWLTRMAGLSIDNLLSAEIVTADGKIRRTSPAEEPDLFWAIRGGGGNFGVVTEFEFRLHEVGPIVQVGLIFWPLEQGREVLRLGREILASLPRDLNIIIAGLNAPPEPFVPEQHQLQPGYAFVVAGFGAPEHHADLMARIRSALPPLWEFASPMPYVALQQLLDEANAWGLHNYEKGTYVEAISDAVIDVVFEKLPAKSSPLSLLIFYPLDGAYSESGEDDTAFGGGRSPRLAVFLVAVCPTPALLPVDRAWVRSTWEALLPYSAGIGSYVNSMTEGEPDRVQASYGPKKYARLAAIKKTYDPDNVFHRNANIRPA